jgi:hypothetical protein
MSFLSSFYQAVPLAFACYAVSQAWVPLQPITMLYQLKLLAVFQLCDADMKADFFDVLVCAFLFPQYSSVMQLLQLSFFYGCMMCFIGAISF